MASEKGKGKNPLFNIFEQVLAADPLRATALDKMGSCLYDLPRYDEASNAFGRALECSPNYAQMHAKSLALDPNQFETLANPADAYLELGRAGDVRVRGEAHHRLEHGESEKEHG